MNEKLPVDFGKLPKVFFFDNKKLPKLVPPGRFIDM
jgi:hypothetical protein